MDTQGRIPRAVPHIDVQVQPLRLLTEQIPENRLPFLLFSALPQFGFSRSLWLWRSRSRWRLHDQSLRAWGFRNNCPKLVIFVRQPINFNLEPSD